MDIALRAFVLFAFVFFVTRIVGRRELSSLDPFDLILLVVVGDAIQQGLTQNDMSVTGAILAVSVFALAQVGVSYLHFRVPRLRPILDGEPIVLLEDGRPIDRNMRRERLTLEDLAEAAREHQIASLEDVRWAVLERNGRISFIPRSGS
jgi:uncharacterized membrane protein YcaP (DUF421 family)